MKRFHVIVLAVLTIIVGVILAPHVMVTFLTNQANVLLLKVVPKQKIPGGATWAFLSSVYLNIYPLSTEQANELTRARDIFSSAMALDPDEQRGLLGYARVQAFLGGLSQSDAAYRRFFARSNFDKIALQEAAVVAQRLGHDERALHLWQESGLAYGPYYSGQYNREQGNWEAAEQELGYVVQIQPKDAKTHYYLCLISGNLGRDPVIVLNHCQDAVRLDGYDTKYRAALANTLAGQGDWDSAIVVAQKASEVIGDEISYYTLGKLLVDIGELKRAESALRESINRKPSAQAYYQIGIVYRRQGNISDAITAWEQALTLDQDYTLAKNAIKDLKRRK
jgi:tetratricopeptide (TPR) repeat protein